MILPALLLFSALTASVRGLSSCVVFDAESNLYVFGGSKDVNLGAAASWTSPTPKTLSTKGRPPFTGTSVSCFLSQSKDLIYILGADKSNQATAYVFNPSSNTWSTQKVSSSNIPNFANTATILDHDTDVFFSLDGTTMKSLDFSSLSGKATTKTLKWVTQGSSGTKKANFKATMAEAQNHLMIFGGDASAGQADIFVVHFSSFQKKAQAFKTLDSTKTFPSTHGQATSFYQKAGVAQRQLAFIPDDFSSTYVLTHWTSPAVAGSSAGAPEGIVPFINTTQILPAPTSKDKLATYAASPLHLVQLTSAGKIYAIQALTGKRNTYTVQPNAKWTTVGFTASGVTAASGKDMANTSDDEVASTQEGNSSSSSTSASSNAPAAQDQDSSAAKRYGGVLAMTSLFAAGVAALF
ncbi:hypothetical protein BT69DRAFT_1329726 [Atractiella rhizophila]|nr:hypothetical protein BT69DRAFT_1329726 [Atractiella rhizophila]